MIKTLGLAAALCGCALTFACSSDTTSAPATGAPAAPVAASDEDASPGEDPPAAQAGDAQTPPTGSYAVIDAWLAKGDYKTWRCEPEAHDARSPSPHGKNRICSNDKASTHTTGEYPVGAANVKELYDAAGRSIVGYAIEYHFTPGKTGAEWYWYERNPEVGAPAKDGSPGLVANGPALKAGTPETDVCAGCHSAAGADAAHPGHDYVYTQVK